MYNNHNNIRVPEGLVGVQEIIREEEVQGEIKVVCPFQEVDVVAMVVKMWKIRKLGEMTQTLNLLCWWANWGEITIFFICY